MTYDKYVCTTCGREFLYGGPTTEHRHCLWCGGKAVSQKEAE